METYLFTTEDVNIHELAKDIEIALPGKTFRLKKSGSNGQGIFDEALSTDDEVIFNDTITDHKDNFFQNITLGSHCEKCDRIDERTKELIQKGFTYDSEIFSLSVEAQLNATGIKVASDSGDLSYPISVSLLYGGEHTLADASEVTAYYLAGLGTKKAHLDSGRALKESVYNAVDQTEYDAIIDNR